MPNTCAAYGCNHRFGPDTKQKGITFHSLPPPTDIRRKLWIANSRRIDPVTKKPWNPVSKYVYFCSEHFMPSDFENTGKPVGRRLKDNAVPTVFTFPTILPPSPPPKHTNKTKSDDSPTDGSSIPGKGKQVPRPKKSKHRKVVMLPKKIKLLQETSPANVESVTIISFQHLDYDEKLQPMFEEAMLDLQYPEESEGEPDEEEEEYYDDQYTELRDKLPLEEDEVEALASVQKDNTPSVEVQNPDAMDCSESDVAKGQLDPASGPNELELSEKEPESDTCIEETTAKLSSPLTEVSPKLNDKQDSEPSTTNIQVEVATHSSTRNGVHSSELKRRAEPVRRFDKEERTVLKRRIPVVIKELSVIDDIEELRTKAFRIAEDNIKLKRQVIYLEQKLEELVSQMYVK